MSCASACHPRKCKTNARVCVCSFLHVRMCVKKQPSQSSCAHMSLRIHMQFFKNGGSTPHPRLNWVQMSAVCVCEAQRSPGAQSEHMCERNRERIFRKRVPWSQQDLKEHHSRLETQNHSCKVSWATSLWGTFS